MELGGKRMRRSTLINLICENVQDLVVLSARGYRSVVFRDSTTATLKMVKDNDEDDSLETALDVRGSNPHQEGMFDDGLQASDIPYEHLVTKSAPDTLQQLLREISIGEQFLPSLLIGKITNSAIKKHPTPFQIVLGVYFNKKKTVKHMHDYFVCCSYDEFLRFKKSSTVAKYLQISNGRWQPIE